MKKRLLCLLLIACMLFGMLPVTAMANSADGFRDVRKNDWYYDSVRYVCANGLFSGVSDTEFDPSGTMTRGMFVTVLGRMAGVDPAEYAGQSRFADVAVDAYYAPYVEWACRYGISNGTGENTFSPDLPIDRQQLACFFARYFELFGVAYTADAAPASDAPADLAKVADWAKDAVVQMWKSGILVGDGVNFDPTANATRAQAATLCDRLDHAVAVWYMKPGVPSDRVRVEPEANRPEAEAPMGGAGGPVNTNAASTNGRRFVRFYDGDRLIDELATRKGYGLYQLPAEEKSAREDAILLGNFYDEEFTKPFYTYDPIMKDTTVYAQYREIEVPEALTVRTFTLMDQSKDLSYTICRSDYPVAGEANEAKLAADVQPKDGSDPVETAARDNGDGTYTIYAPDGFREGCSYELTLSDGWIFAGKEPSIRTATFSIFMEEVENMRMGDDIIYIADTDAMDYAVSGGSYPVLTSDVLSLVGAGEGSFPYADNTLAAGDVLCIYTGVHPAERGNNRDLLDPAVYVKVTGNAGGLVSFAALDEEAQQDLYELPDNFPILVAELPTEETGTISLADLDVSMYETMLGEVEGTLDNARAKLSLGDFVTLYVSNLETTLTGSEEELYFGRVDAIDGDMITYTHVTRQDVIDSMDLNVDIDLEAGDILDEAQMQAVQEQVLYQVRQSGFAEEAADLLLDAAMATEEFRGDTYALRMLATDENGNELSAQQMMSLRGSFNRNRVDLDVKVGSGNRYGGVSVIICVDAEFTVEAEDGFVVIRLYAEFEEEMMIAPGARGELVYKEILGIPIPIGVYINASVDIKNFTSFSFDAEVTTKSEDGSVLNETSISSELNEVMQIANQTGISEDYEQTMEALLQKYSQMLSTETDWIQLVEEEICKVEINFYGLVLGVSADFVVRTDMSIAIGSGLQYEVGKRYTMWFKIGLFEPTAGSDVIDLIDEQFAFHFYVLGKLGVKAGIKAKIYAGIAGDVANIGIAAELGPYIKLWGLFIYDYSRTRPAGSGQWITSSRMMGGLTLEFGLYLILSFEAEALGLFEYTHDFLDEEYPLLEAGDPKFYYSMNYEPKEDEKVLIWDEDRDNANGITASLPDCLRTVNCLNLKNGVFSTDLLGYENFAVTLSNPNFTFDRSTGKISVFVPEDIHYMTCEATVTYLGGKMAFSKYDMSVTVPLAWTDLSRSELKEYYTATVRVGNAEDGYERVWSTRVLRGEAFNLPSDEEIRDLVNWNELKYEAAVGYTEEQTTGLTITGDTLYTYDIVPRTYTITVDGIENADGTYGAPRTYTAKYGQQFDFSDLETTGTDDAANDIYTAFYNVTTDVLLPTAVSAGVDGYVEMDTQPMDLYLPITGSIAEALKSGDVRATANYVDDSTTAVFTFNGLTHEDVTVTLRKGTVPSMAQVEAVLAEEVLKNNGQPLGISELSPKLDAIDRSTNFVVTCTGLSGARANVNFDCTGGYALEPVDKLVGSLIVNIPEASRRGYTFLGWFTEPEGAGQNAFTQTVPADGITIYAHWKPNTYCATFHMNGGDGNVPEPVLVTYDALYGNGNVYVAAPDTESGFTKGEAYGDLPVPTYTGYKFLGWSTEPNRRADGALRVEDSTIANIYDSNHVLYAQWKKLEVLPQNVFVFGSRQYTTYDGSQKTAAYTINTSLQYNDEDYYGKNMKNFTKEMLADAQVVYKRQGILSEWEPYAKNAGVYDVKITRASDGNHAAFTGIYYGVLEVEKAESSMNQTPTAACIDEMYYGNLVMNPNSITNYTGDGTVEFAVTSSSSSAPSESQWTSGVVYNSQTSGSFYLWVRLSEGDNYNASNAVCSASAISRTGSAPKQLIADDYDGQGFWYTMEIKTSDTSKSGTDSEVYVSIGNGPKVLTDSDDNDHETGDCREYLVTMKDYLPNAVSSIPVTISLNKGGLAPGWKLGYLRLNVYKKTGSDLMSMAKDLSKEPVLRSDKLTCNDWFISDGNPSSRSYTLTGLGRSVNCAVTGPTGDVDVTANSTLTLTAAHSVKDANRAGLTYNGAQRKSAPKFVASFSQLDKGFNKYLHWSLDESNGQWVCYVDCDGIYNRMNEIGIYHLELNYGIASQGLRTLYLVCPD